MEANTIIIPIKNKYNNPFSIFCCVFLLYGTFIIFIFSTIIHNILVTAYH